MRCLIRYAKVHPYSAAGVLCALGVVVASLAFADRQIVINTSPSVAPGLYLRSRDAPAVGRLVDFRVPAAAAEFVRLRTHGRTDGRNWYILKPIAAGPGDNVDCTGRWLVINGRRVASMPPAVDDAGRPLPVWRGRRTLADDEFFVFSGRIPNSFDSRCYGPIRRGEIEAVRRPLITW
jgi:conjugative transfer signal peptidase TraF